METPITVSVRRYNPEQDFLRIRDFFSETYQAFGKPLNWRIERWNWSRYHPIMFDGDSEKKIRFWEAAVKIWENDEKEIVGVVNVESPRYGMPYLHRRPGYIFLLGEMVDYAETALVNKEDNVLAINVYTHDEPFQALLRERGYRQDREHVGSGQRFYEAIGFDKKYISYCWKKEF